MTYGEQRCNYHLQVYLFYRQRKKKTSSILLKSSVRCRKPGPGVRHALWTEVVKKILKIVRFLTHHLDGCCTTPLLCLTCVKTYVKINVSKLSTFHE